MPTPREFLGTNLTDVQIRSVKVATVVAKVWQTPKKVVKVFFIFCIFHREIRASGNMSLLTVLVAAYYIESP